MANDFVNTPATILSDFPKGLAFGQIPRVAQAAANLMLKPQARALLYFYMSGEDGFAASARLVESYTGLKQPNMIKARKELIDHKFIAFDHQKNTITILWKNIETAGKVALMLADNEGCDVRETLNGGKFSFEG